MSKVRELILKAADILEKQGHCKYTYRDIEGRVCMNQALDLARTYDVQTYYDAQKHIARFLSSSLSDPAIVICEFNNRDSTDLQVAVRTMRDAAATAEAA